MNHDCIYYVSCFYDIGRSGWATFARTFDDYLAEFEPFKNIFAPEDGAKHRFIVFMDEKYTSRFSDFLNEGAEEKSYPSFEYIPDGRWAEKNILMIRINEDWLEKHTQWKDIDKEREVMGSAEFKEIVGDRIKFPESRIPEYTMINHIKVDLLKYIFDYKIEGDLTKSYLAWLDFGFFKKDHLLKGRERYVPERLLDPTLFDADKVNYTIVNEIKELDLDVHYTLKNAPEKVAGYFFILRSDKISSYHSLYLTTLKDLRQNHVVDDDQHVVLQCYARSPNLFKFHQIPWHTALVKFQNREALPKEFLSGFFEKSKIESIFALDSQSDKSEEMLTIFGLGINLDQCKLLKYIYPNSKIYVVYDSDLPMFFLFPGMKGCDLPGMVGISTPFVSNNKIPRKDKFERILKKELKYIEFDRILY